MANTTKRKASSVDVARLAGVSQATVSYVLNQRPDQIIREETRQKVLDAVQALGYQPNHAARAMVTGKSHMVALWVPNSYRSVFNHVIQQMMRCAEASNFHIIIVQIKTETAETLKTNGLLSVGNVDAILALDARDLVDEIVAKHAGAPPIVSIGPAYSTHTDHVGVDLHDGSLQAVRHLVERGCRRIAFAGLKDKMEPGDPRYDAYLEATAEAGLKPEIIPLEVGDYEGGYQVLRGYFQAGHRLDGLFCWNDETAIGANRALADMGLRVPDDVAVMGSDGTRETAFAVPTISTMAQPFDDMCRLAWEFLQNRLNSPNLPLQTAVLPMHLEPRVSTQRR